MDKISSYPSRLLEADARAESNWARAPNHWTRPSDWRQLRITWAQVTGPDCTITGQAQVIGAIPCVWAGHVAHFYRLGLISKTVPFSETASFS